MRFSRVAFADGKVSEPISGAPDVLALVAFFRWYEETKLNANN